MNVFRPSEGTLKAHVAFLEFSKSIFHSNTLKEALTSSLEVASLLQVLPPSRRFGLEFSGDGASFKFGELIGDRMTSNLAGVDGLRGRSKSTASKNALGGTSGWMIVEILTGEVDGD